MGMYTGCAFEAPLNALGVEVVTLLNDTQCWTEVANRFPQFRAWVLVGRCNFVPFGGIAYLEWHDLFAGGQTSELSPEGVWKVACSLKNYEGEIETFIADVLPTLVSGPVEVFSLYEEADEPTSTWVFAKADTTLVGWDAHPMDP